MNVHAGLHTHDEDIALSFLAASAKRETWQITPLSVLEKTFKRKAN